MVVQIDSVMLIDVYACLLSGLQLNTKEAHNIAGEQAIQKPMSKVPLHSLLFM